MHAAVHRTDESQLGENSCPWLFHLLFSGQLTQAAQAAQAAQAGQHCSFAAVWFRVRLPVISTASIASPCDMVQLTSNKTSYSIQLPV